MSETNSTSGKKPVWAILSVVLTPAAVVFAMATAIVIELAVNKPAGLSTPEHFPATTRVMVLITVAIIATGIISAFVAWFRRESPPWLPAVGLATTILIVTVFHFLAGPDD